MTRSISQPQLATLIFLIALIFRISAIAHHEVWYDEILTIVQSQKSWSDILHQVPTPIHYLITKLFVSKDQSLYLMAVPSMLAGLLSVFLVREIGNFNSRGLGLVGMLLAAVSPMMVEFSSQILFFSYFVCFSLATVLLVLRIDRKPTDVWAWVLFISMAVILILTKMMGLVSIICSGAFLVWSLVRSANYKYLIGILVLSSAILLPIFADPQWREFIINTLASIGDDRTITLGWSLSHELNSQYLNNKPLFFLAMFKWFGFGTYYELIFTIPLFVVGIISLRHTAPPLATLILINLCLSFILLFTIKLDHWFEEKYFIFILPLYLLGVAQGILSITKICVESWRLNKKVIAFIWLILIAIFASYGHLKRTTFGFAFEGFVPYEWGKSVKHLVKNNKVERILLRDGIDQFVSLYERDIPLQKMNEVKGDIFKENWSDTYVMTIPDFPDLELGKLLEFEKLGVFYGINHYKVTGVKPVKLAQEGDVISFSDHSFFRYARVSSAVWSFQKKINPPTKPETFYYLQFHPNSDFKWGIDNSKGCQSVLVDTFIKGPGEFVFYVKNKLIPSVVTQQDANYKTYEVDICSKEASASEVQVLFESNIKNSVGEIFRLTHRRQKASEPISNSKEVINFAGKGNNTWRDLSTSAVSWALNAAGHLEPICHREIPEHAMIFNIPEKLRSGWLAIKYQDPPPSFEIKVGGSSYVPFEENNGNSLTLINLGDQPRAASTFMLSTRCETTGRFSNFVIRSLYLHAEKPKN